MVARVDKRDDVAALTVTADGAESDVVKKAQRLMFPFKLRVLSQEEEEEDRGKDDAEEDSSISFPLHPQSEARRILRVILARQGRRLPSRLWPYVLAKAAKEPTPFYLRLAARVICLHYDEPHHQDKLGQQQLREDLQLAAGVAGLVLQLVELLRGRHDAGLVDAALALITFAPEGLSEVGKAVQLTRV